MGWHVERLVFLNLFVIRQPFQAILSISHRITGVLLLFFLPYWTYSLYILRTGSNFQFEHLSQNLWGYILTRLGIILFLAHAVLGLRHILSDKGYIQYKHHGISGSVSLILWAIVCIGYTLWF